MSYLSKLSDTLNELMLLNNLNEKAFAEQSGIPIACISSYVRGLQAPYVDTLIKLSDFLNVRLITCWVARIRLIKFIKQLFPFRKDSKNYSN